MQRLANTRALVLAVVALSSLARPARGEKGCRLSGSVYAASLSEASRKGIMLRARGETAPWGKIKGSIFAGENPEGKVTVFVGDAGRGAPAHLVGKGITVTAEVDPRELRVVPTRAVLWGRTIASYATEVAIREVRPDGEISVEVRPEVLLGLRAHVPLTAAVPCAALVLGEADPAPPEDARKLLSVGKGKATVLDLPGTLPLSAEADGSDVEVDLNIKMSVPATLLEKRGRSVRVLIDESGFLVVGWLPARLGRRGRSREPIAGTLTGVMSSDPPSPPELTRCPDRLPLSASGSARPTLVVGDIAPDTPFRIKTRGPEHTSIELVGGWLLPVENVELVVKSAALKPCQAR